MRYFIAYATQGPGFGTAEIKRRRRIRNMEDIKAIQVELQRETGISTLVILWWRRWR